METVKEAAMEYQRIKAAIKKLEEQIKPHKALLEEKCMLRGAPKDDNYVLDIDGLKISLLGKSRQNFNLKSAKIILGDVLNPFISTSFYTELRVKDDRAFTEKSLDDAELLVEEQQELKAVGSK